MILRRKPTKVMEQKPSASLQKTLGRFQADRRGSTAIEFSLLALPFFALVFAIMESSLSFTAQQILANATDDVARDVRTGRFKGSAVTENAVKGRICDKLSVLVAAGCPELEVDLQTYARYSQVPRSIPFKANGDIDTSGFNVRAGPSQSINNIRTFYRWPVIADIMRGKLSNLPDDKTLLYATTTWKNEPFED